jgi:CheY-like chemotaxis protein
MGESERATPEQSEAPPEAHRGEGARTVLVVDDDPGVRSFVGAVLRASGYEVVAAADGREAMRFVYGSSSTPALLITDLEMPVMGGVELAARLKAERPQLRVVLMTGRPDSVAAALDRPMVAGVLLKPFTVDALRTAVSRALGTRVGP